MTPFSKSTDDLVLWRLFREGDEDAYCELSKRYYPKLIHYGQKFTPNVQLVEDALQDLLVHLWVYRRTLNDTPSVTFYLLKAFRHQLFKALRKYPRQDEWGEYMDESTLDAAFNERYLEFSTEDLYIQHESDLGFRNKVEEQLAQLPARQREVIYLRFFQGLSIDEIADLMSIRPQSVSNVIQRALANLRENWPIAFSLLLTVAGLSSEWILPLVLVYLGYCF